MNYFELYGLPVSFNIDRAAVKKRYYELSRAFHPDFFSQQEGASQEEALQMSAEINKAYKIFQRKEDIIRYVLQWKGLLEEEEKYRLDAAFLEEVMDINEQLMELEMEADASVFKRIEASTNQLLDKIYKDVEVVIENYQEGVSSEEELLQVKDFYFRKKYLQRILDKMTQMRNIATP